MDALRPESDERIAAAAANGDRAALRALIERMARRFRNVAWHMTYDRHDAEDLCQEALLKICQPAVLRRYRSDAPLDAYLTRVGVNEMISRRRGAGQRVWSERTQLAPELPDVATPEADPLTNATAAELDPELRSALNALPSAAREVVVLIALGELSYREVAETTGRNENTIRSIYHRARGQLTASLSPRLAPPGKAER